MQKGTHTHPRSQPKEANSKLLACCFVHLEPAGDPIEIQRGQQVITRDGLPVGIVAAVLVNCQLAAATHFLLGFVPPAATYPLIPLSLIHRIHQKIIWLQIRAEEIEGLPVYRPPC